MCSRTPIWCPECGGTLFLPRAGETECAAGHVTPVEKLSLGPGEQITTQYHAAGRSRVLAQAVCRRCAPQ